MVLLKFYLKFATGNPTKISTFHYGSIKIISYSNSAVFCITSTFHYGSIKIEIFVQIGQNREVSTFHYGSIKICFKYVSMG